MAGGDSTPDRGDLPVLYSLPFMSVDSRGGISTGLTVVTEDGRPLRIIGVRYPGGDVQRAEITVADEDR